MDNITHVADRLRQLVQSHDRERALEAVFGSAMGLAFTAVTFGVVFGLSWFFGLSFGRHLGLHAWQFGLLVAAVFLVAAVWSAWQQVDPFAGLAPPSDEQMLLTYISHMSSDFFYASPRHVTAGTAAILIGGPANLFKAVGVWRPRLRADASRINDAARLLADCREKFPAAQVCRPAAASLLKRLALIKFVPAGDSVDLTVTERGAKVLSKGRKVEISD
jgi:hypothetical protein